MIVEFLKSVQKNVAYRVINVMNSRDARDKIINVIWFSLIFFFFFFYFMPSKMAGATYVRVENQI